MAFGALHVLSFLDRPAHGAVTHVTLGLSRHPLRQTSGEVRQELLISCDPSWESPGVVGLLSHVAGEVALAGKPLIFGEAVPLDVQMAGVPRIDALLAIDPRHFDEGLHTFSGGGTPTAITWLVPITREEFTFVAEAGPDPFLKLLGEQQPDLLRVRSRSIPGIS